MPAPTVAAYQETASWSASGAQTIPSVSWSAGDLVVVVSLLANGASGSVADPTATGLTFAQVTGSPVGSGSGQGVAQMWTATAAGNGSSTIGSMTNPVQWGGCCWVFSGHGGAGTPATGADTAKTVSLTRAANNSLVCGGVTDWEAATVGSLTPAGATARQVSQEGSYQSVYAGDWPDQGSAGPASYGFSGGGGTTGPYSKIFVEIKGIAGGSTSGPNYAGSAADLGGGSGSWSNVANAQGGDDATYATWAVP